MSAPETLRVGTLVIGGGVIGSSVAMHLARSGAPDVRVIDPDLEGTLSSSELNAGGVRATFGLPINVRMSQASIDYFATVATEVGYRDCGYLWLLAADRVEAASRARDLQRGLGWPSEMLDPSGVRARAPFLDKLEGVVAGVFAPRDGLLNPNLLKQHYRARARAAGAAFDDRVRFRHADYAGTSPGARLRIHASRLPVTWSEDAKRTLLGGGEADGAPVIYSADQVVNCAGPWAARVAEGLGYVSPAHAVRRQVSIFDCRDVDLSPYGMIVDTSGVYFHPEATNGLAGFATAQEPVGFNFDYDGEAFFNEWIWPALYERSHAFERLKHVTGWAGLYEVSPDESAILGRVRAGSAGAQGRVFEAHSFSGHGVMHSFAAGRALAELMTTGRFDALDAGELDGERFAAGRAVREGMVI